MNKDLFLEGVEYISAGQAAKKIGYASDYVGQLCRDGKVPGKLIGRTWYVDFSSLLNHKISSSTRKKKSAVATEINDGTSFVAVPTEVKSEENLPRKLKESTPVEAKISAISRQAEPRYTPLKIKIPPPRAFVITKKPSRAFKIIKVSIGTFLFLMLAVSTLSMGLEGSPNPLKLATALFSETNTAAVGQGQGIVVVPDSADHNALVSRIQNFFSDDVTIAFDEDADTGVITPVFHEGDDSEHYAFVMVPIKKAQ
ncbi:hypothetical protein KW785_00585 [Candidatus Parcubacteria bacterium]|nr:hypothetical protein [Candidatus Parcubacteria bacterium]